MGKINLNRFDFDEVGGTKKFKKSRKAHRGTFDGDYSDMKKQYKRNKYE